MTSERFHTQAVDGRACPGPRCATLIKACYTATHPHHTKGEKKKRTLNYANLKDKYFFNLIKKQVNANNWWANFVQGDDF